MAEEETTVKDIDKEAPAEPVATDADTTTAAPKVPTKRKKVKRSVPTGQMHVLATFNNTIISFSDTRGGVLASSSAGACGFRGSKKGTAYAAQVATEKAAQIAKQQYGLSKVEVFIKGIGLGREAAVRSLQNVDIFVDSIQDVTGIPHGGVRPPKARRV